MDGWKPIEDAPRDGTEIDIWIGNSLGGYRIVNCWWSAVDGYWFGPMGGPAQNLMHQAGAPTYWMPLPAPPKDKRHLQDVSYVLTATNPAP